MVTLKLSDFSVAPDDKKQNAGGLQKNGGDFDVGMLMHFMSFGQVVVPQSMTYSRARGPISR